MKKLIEKAGVLIEALPYIRNFYGKTFVIKYGGAAQSKEALKDAFAQDVVLMNFIGIKPVIVHGGGPRITAMMKKLGKKVDFVHGQRVTDPETMEIVEMVLGGLVNKEIVSMINSHGGRAVGLSGKDGGLISAKKKLIRRSTAGSDNEETLDIGLVGDVSGVRAKILHSLQKEGIIPVISPVGVGQKGETYNINADYVASAVASVLKAEKLILLTDVPGIVDKKDEVISTVKRSDVPRMIRSGAISGGMHPKADACVNALKGGVRKTHIIDGRVPHCLLLEIFTSTGIGTEIVPGRQKKYPSPE